MFTPKYRQHLGHSLRIATAIKPLTGLAAAQKMAFGQQFVQVSRDGRPGINQTDVAGQATAPTVVE